MTASTVTVNGHKFEEYKGGYTPFSFELTPHLKYGADNVIAVELDSTERSRYPAVRIPDRLPDLRRHLSRRSTARGAGNLHRERVRQAGAAPGRRPRGCRALLPAGSGGRRGDAHGRTAGGCKGAEDGKRTGRGRSRVSRGPDRLAPRNRPLESEESQAVQRGRAPGECGRFQRRVPHAHRFPRGALYSGRLHAERRAHQAARPEPAPDISLMSAARCPRACSGATPGFCARELRCNIVRTSHYPQSPAFLDACDELGLLVLEEIPGWQHIGDKAWQDLAVRNVGEMIRRDWNHPSIVLWGVRINESMDNHDFYTRTNAAGPLARRRAPDRRHPLLAQLGAARRRVHDERFRFPAEGAESPPVYEHRVQRAHVLDQALRQRVARCRARDPARARSQSARLGRPLRRRHRMVRLRLQHAPELRLRRPHLLSRSHRHLPHSEAGGVFLRVAVRAGTKRWCSRRASSFPRATSRRRAARARCRFSPTAST